MKAILIVAAELLITLGALWLVSRPPNAHEQRVEKEKCDALKMGCRLHG